MKEVFTKSFWQGVKKTFHEALEDPPSDNALKAPAQGDPNASSAPVTPSPSATSSAPSVPSGTCGTTP